MSSRNMTVQLDDDLIAALDTVARIKGITRSSLLQDAVRLLVDGHRRQEELRHMNGYLRIPQTESEGEDLFRISRETLPPWDGSS